MEGEGGRRRIWPWLVVGLLLALLGVLYFTAFPPTALLVSVVDATTGQPIAGARVQVQPVGMRPLPTASTDERGRARLEDVPPAAALTVRVQKIDYGLAAESQAELPKGKVTRLSVALWPAGGGRLFVGLGESRLAEIDTASLLLVRTLQLPGREGQQVNHLLLHPDEDLLYAIAGEQGYAVDRREAALVAELAISNPWRWPDPVEAWGLSADGQKLYVWGQSYRGPFMVLDAHSGKFLTGTYPVDIGINAQGFLVPRPSDAALYVVDLEDGSVHDLDAIAPRILAGWPVAGRAGYVLSADGQSLLSYRSEAGGGAGPPTSLVESRRIDGRTSTVVRWTLAAGVSALADSPTTGQVCALNGALDSLTLLDPDGREAPVAVPVGRGPVALVVSPDGEWAYVANRLSRDVSVVHLPSARLVATIPVGGEPLSLAVR